MVIVLIYGENNYFRMYLLNRLQSYDFLCIMQMFSAGKTKKHIIIYRAYISEWFFQGIVCRQVMGIAARLSEWILGAATCCCEHCGA